MVRIVKRTRGGPYPVIIGGETRHICGCGLSNTQPFCNGTHKISLEEDPNKLYWYDEQGNRFETSGRARAVANGKSVSSMLLQGYVSAYLKLQ